MSPVPMAAGSWRSSGTPDTSPEMASRKVHLVALASLRDRKICCSCSYKLLKHS
uniref:Uncharacterized protein n=1 Tax=Setaria italica TaxID=4555 RepID=K3YFC4_SETIT